MTTLRRLPLGWPVAAALLLLAGPALAQPACIGAQRKIDEAGARVRFADAFDAEVLGRCGPDDGLFHLRFEGDPFTLLERHGHVPLPPYITHADEEDDVRRYQTVFAKESSAAAASCSPMTAAWRRARRCCPASSPAPTSCCFPSTASATTPPAP